MRVHFTGGALTSYGVTPAEFTTSNPFIQKVIENSSYFKEGRIIVQRRAAIEESQKPAPKAKPKAQPAFQSTPAQQPKAEETVVDTPAPAPVPVETEAEEAAEPDAAAEAPAEESEATGITKVPVTCLPDAQAYIQENFNISSYKVRSCEIAQKIAAEHGIQFTGGKFDTLSGSKTEDEAKEEE